MSENIIQECETRLNSLQRGIETATGESYNDLTEAVNMVLNRALVAMGAKSIGLYGCTTIKSIDFPLDVSKTENLIDCLYGTTNLKTMVGFKSTSHIKYFNFLFQRSGIVSVELPFDLSRAAGGYAQNIAIQAYNLEEIRFVEETISENNINFSDNTKLSAESVLSIAKGLAVITSAKTVIFSTKTVIADEIKTLIAGKGWTLVQK